MDSLKLVFRFMKKTPFGGFRDPVPCMVRPVKVIFDHEIQSFDFVSVFHDISLMVKSMELADFRNAKALIKCF